MKNNNPLVSIVIPTHNRANLLGRCVQSILNQTYENFELIIVDDASTDNTKNIIKRFKDKRIIYIKHKKNLGGGAARNTGIKTAKGNFIAFQDSDDEWLPQKLEKQMNAFETASKNTGVIYTAFWRIENGKKTYIPNNIQNKQGNIHQELLKGNFVTTQSAVVKKECFEKAGVFDEDLPSGQDWELWIRISKYHNFKIINEPLVISYFTKGSITDTRKNDYKTLEFILNKHIGDFKQNKKLLAANYLYISQLSDNPNRKKEYFWKAVKVHPFYTAVLLFVRFFRGI